MGGEGVASCSLPGVRVGVCVQVSGWRGGLNVLPIPLEVLSQVACAVPFLSPPVFAPGSLEVVVGLLVCLVVAVSSCS